MTRIVKVGGSLLEYDHLVPALRKWLAAQSPDVNVLIVGGGPLADLIRQADARFAIGEESSHWLCVNLLSITARMLAAVLSDAELIESYDRLQHVLSSHQQHRDSAPATVIFTPEDFLRRSEPHVLGQPLPHNWTVTTDSIAARLAHAVGADELVLLKSADPPQPHTCQAAGEGDFADAHFPIAAQSLPRVRCVNLRDSGLLEL
jgi:aspartokinase-like uncharacterized kinase